MASHLDNFPEAYGPLSALPTEIWYYVLSFLDSGEKMTFARCSWLCFFIAFPNGVKLPEDPNNWSLKPFVDGGRLAAFKDRIRSARFDITDIRNLNSLFHKVVIFPNLCRLEINIVGSSALQKELFDAVFSLLSTLPYFGNLKHLALGWHTSYGGEITFLQQAEREFLSSLAPVTKSLDKIDFPDSLRSFSLFVPNIQYLMPMLSHERVKTLVLLFPVKETTFELQNIKTLTVDSQYPLHKLGLDILPRQFPNVESFSLVRTKPGAPNQHWILSIPNFSKITKLVMAWPQIDGRNAGVDTLEVALETKLSTTDDLRTLRTIKFVGYRDLADHRRIIEATCRISSVENEKSDKKWVFDWEGDTSNPHDDSSFWTTLLDDSSGDDWEEGNTDKEDCEMDEDELESEEEEGEYDSEDSEYFEYLASDDELYVKDMDEDA